MSRPGRPPKQGSPALQKRCLRVARRRAGALADDDFRGETLGENLLAAHNARHAFHGGRAQAQLGLANRGQRHPKMFADQNIAEANNRGGEDNITVVLVRFLGDDLEEPTGDHITVELPVLEEDKTLDDSYEADTESY